MSSRAPLSVNSNGAISAANLEDLAPIAHLRSQRAAPFAPFVTAFAIAGAVGPILMGRAFDATGSYTTLLTQLALGTFLIAALMLLMPPYEHARARRALEPSLG